MNPCRCGYLGDPAQACNRAPRCGTDGPTADYQLPPPPPPPPPPTEPPNPPPPPPLLDGAVLAELVDA
jgi:hypothetical protein